MSKLKVVAKTCYLGKTGYAAHARGFFRELSNLVDLRIINYTWDDNYESYLNETDRSILWKVILSTAEGPKMFDPHTQQHFEKHEWLNSGSEFNPDIEIVLIDNGHYFFRNDSPYPGTKYRIAYTVWESTELDTNFIDILKRDFDQVWVVTQWHKTCLINQGIESSKIHIVREAVDSELVPLNFYDKEFHPIEYYRDDYFNFIFFGRWDYRKCLPEILDAFLDEFDKDEKVRFIMSAENPFSPDGKTAVEKLKEYGIEDERIVSIGFVNRLKYLRYLQSGQCFVSCARSEGWNIPLIEAMAVGTPSIYSDWGAQLEFAGGRGIPVKVKGEVPAAIGHEKGLGPAFPGNYADPDFEDLKRALRFAKDNYSDLREKALEESEEIRKEFTWKNAAISGVIALSKLSEMEPVQETEETVIDSVSVHFVDGPYVEIKGKGKKRFKALFVDRKTGTVVYETTLAPGEWARCNRKWWTDWHIQILDDQEIIWEHVFDVKDKRIFISLESSSLGDNLAWFPHAEVFRKEKEAHVIVSTFQNDLFQDQYPELEFSPKGVGVPDLYACFRIGWFYRDDKDEFNPSMHPRNFRTISMQEACTDILGLPFTHERPLIKIPDSPHPFDGKKYVTIAIHGTAQAKYWNNPSGWQDLVDFLRDHGYRIVLISAEEKGFMGNNHPKDIFHKPGKPPLEERINEIKHSDLFIGIGSGLSWLAWATGVPMIMISGFSEPYSEFSDDNMIRIINTDTCTGCFNRYRLDAGDWNWCPDHKGTPRQFECTKMIGSYQVIKAIKKLLEI
jgi:autotransporter strand-loop-strand O-heptosyltransferase